MSASIKFEQTVPPVESVTLVLTDEQARGLVRSLRRVGLNHRCIDGSHGIVGDIVDAYEKAGINTNFF